jgi:hypothetical protein
MIDLINMIYPRRVRKQCVQLVSLASNFASSFVHDTFQITLSKSGDPRYFEGRVACWNPRICVIFLFTTIGVLKKQI